MIEVKSDAENQRLYIISDQALNPDEVQEIISRMRVEVKNLHPGFAVAVDFRGMWVKDPYLNERIKTLQEALLACGARKIGTLLDNPAVRLRLSQEGQRTRSNEITQRFYTEQEWEKFLAQP